MLSRDNLILLLTVLLAVVVWRNQSIATTRFEEINTELANLRDTLAAPSAGAKAAVPLPAVPLSLDQPRMGSKRAKVAIIEYSDFQCPYCGAFAQETLPLIKREFVDSGRVVFAFRHLPLTGLHSQAFQAAVYADCAGQQDKFWPMHDQLFAARKKLDDTVMRGLANGLSLEAAGLQQCVKNGGPERIAQSANEANQLGISSTPTFVVGSVTADGKMKAVQIIPGAKPIEVFRLAIEQALNSPGTQD